MRTAATTLLSLACLCTMSTAQAQTLTRAQQIAAAVSPAPAELQQDAAVMVFENGRWTTVRQGTNEMICLGDEPGDDRFHVACYHKALDPFMARGRELEAAGTPRDQIQQIREREARAGTPWKMPDVPAALYSYTGPAGSFDPATGQVKGLGKLHVIYVPFATQETTGLTTTPGPGVPWLMNPGMPWAHIMLMPSE